MSFWDKCLGLSKESKDFVTVTLVNVRGSAPQDPGAKIIVTKTGLYFGTVGGGKVEAAAIKKAQEILDQKSNSSPQYLTWNLQKDIGMSCGGEVSFLFEYFESYSWQIVIFGAGHVAQALTRVLSPLHCQITCIDPREDWINKLEGIEAICHPEPKELVKKCNPNSFFLSMTMGHAFDVPILYEIGKTFPEAKYVGVIGSEVKGIKIKKELMELGLDKKFIDKIRVPMGLPLGTNHPHEIAISITAELIQTRDQLPHKV